MRHTVEGVKCKLLYTLFTLAEPKFSWIAFLLFNIIFTLQIAQLGLDKL
jgi:hypothetical protein